MPGRLLCINEGFGYRQVLVVRFFQFVPQLNDRPESTWVFGNQLIVNADIPTEYMKFMETVIGQELPWVQAGLNDELSADTIYAMWPKMPMRKVMEQPLTVLHAGKDPIKGYYVQFAGRMRLFSQPEWWKDGHEYES